MLKSSQIVAVVGALFGDEGKAKIVDYLSKDFDYVVRYQGGDNAGHTIYLEDNTKFVFRFIPSGVFHSKVLISHGVVLNPAQFIVEMESLDKLVSIKDRVFVSKNVQIIFDWAIACDRLIEQIKSDDRVGTTGKGIGPTYAFKALRVNMRAIDLLDKDAMRRKIKYVIEFLNPLFKAKGYETFDLESCVKKYWELGQKLKPLLVDTFEFMHQEIKNGKRFLLEGSQGLMLDLDMGTYPCVTSSNIVGDLLSGTGLPPLVFKNGLLGVVKSYVTRVGCGEFITEIQDENLAGYIREVGNEYGSVTARPRRIGWMDLVALKYSCKFSGISSIALTLVDVLNDIIGGEVKVCVDYLDDEGNSISWTSREGKKLTPIYKTFKKWSDDYTKIEKYEDFSQEFRDFAEFIANYLDVKLSMISYGKSRKDILSLDE